MRRWGLLFLAFLLLPGVWLRAGERRVVEEIVARVNNEMITLSQLERSREELRQELSQQYSGEELEQKYREEEKKLLRDLIDQELLVQRATDMGISVEADVIRRLDKMRQDAGLSSMEELERAVAAQGMLIEDLRQQIREQLLTRQVMQRELAGRVILDSDEVRQYYLEHRQEMARPESVHLREILVSTVGYFGEELEARADRVREILHKIRRGEPFDELAREYSDAPTGEDGGDLGIFEIDKLAPQIREIVGKLRESGVSDPLRTPDGYLILQLVDHLSAGIPSFEEVEPQIMQHLYFEEMTPALREFLSQLRREAYVYVKAGYVDTGAVEPEPKPVVRGRRRRRRRQ